MAARIGNRKIGNDFKADLYGLTALSISVARNALLEQRPAEINTFFGFEIGNREFAALHFRCRSSSHQVCLGLACCLNVASRVGLGGKFMHPEVLVCCNFFAFRRACQVNRLCARFLGVSGWWVSFGVLHASVQVIVDGTGLIMACIRGLWQNVAWQH